MTKLLGKCVVLTLVGSASALSSGYDAYAEATRSVLSPAKQKDVVLRSFNEQKKAAIKRELTKQEERRKYLGEVCSLIEKTAKHYDMPPGFLARLLWQESRFNPNAVSPKGASGIAQFMPATARERGLADPFDFRQAIPASAGYLSELRLTLGNLGLAAAGYNAGPNRVAAWRSGTKTLPRETQNFVSIITGYDAEDWTNSPLPKAVFRLKKDIPFKTACRDFPIKAQTAAATTSFAPWQPWGVHITTHRSRNKAIAIYKRVQKQQPKLLKGVSPMMLTMRRNSFGKAPRYAVRVGKPNRAQAVKFCNRLRSAGGACLVKKSPR